MHRRLDGQDGRLAQLVRLYAIESGQPAISKTKREGLAAHYGIGDGPGNEYFRLHETADVEHAAEGRSLIEAHLEDADVDALVEAAEAAFNANWRLLDGVTAYRRQGATHRQRARASV